MEFARGDGTPRFNPFFIPKMILDIGASPVSMRYGFRGAQFLQLTCQQYENAIIDAYDNIRLGKADIMLSGASVKPLFVKLVLEGFK
jgi:3-oxoacyl-[acyl-carrier-protein] synthase II